MVFAGTEIGNFDTIHFRYIDFGRDSQSQIESLIGKFNTVFGDSILDHKAALFTFLRELHNIETTFNQGNVARLSDKTKRLESSEIDDILNVLTTKKLAFDFWRNKQGEICNSLAITISNRDNFRMHYENSFDKFKDLNESEHQKVYKFVEDNRAIYDNHTDEVDCILELLTKFIKEKSTTLLDIQMKAVVSAAYFKIKSLYYAVNS